MSEVHEQALIDAPVVEVWELVGNPGSYTDWLPRVFESRGSASRRALNSSRFHASAAASRPNP
jgi:hypothetical protein